MAIVNQFPGGGSGAVTPTGYGNVIVMLGDFNNGGIDADGFCYFSFNQRMYYAYCSKSRSITNYKCDRSFFTLKAKTATLKIGGNQAYSESSKAIYESSSFTFLPGVIYKASISKGVTFSNSRYTGYAIMRIYSDNYSVAALSCRIGNSTTSSLAARSYFLHAVIDFNS